MIATEILEQRVLDLKAKISRYNERLEKVETALHRRRLQELGWVGRTARSDRVPGGIVITDVIFKTWDPTVPQAAIGHRVTNNCQTTIHVTSPGFRLHDPDRQSTAA